MQHSPTALTDPIIKTLYSLKSDQLRLILKECADIIEARSQEERKTAIAEILGIAKAFNLSFDDLKELGQGAGHAKRGPKKGTIRGPQPAKYRHPETGETWAGFGRRPQFVTDWLAADKPLADLAISPA